MEQTEINQIVLASVSAAGPVGEDQSAWSLSVQENAARITAMCSPRSSVAKIINGVAGSKVFPATLLQITKESSSTRGLVKLKTQPSEHHQDGIEEARTERTDTQIGVGMARRLRGLLFHRIVVWIELEEAGSQRKVRVIRHVEDLGVDPEFAQEAAEAKARAEARAKELEAAARQSELTGSVV